MNQHIHVSFRVLGSPAMEVTKIHGIERIGDPFEFVAHVVVLDPAGLDDDVLTHSAALSFERHGTVEREMFGIVSTMEDVTDVTADYHAYELTFVPRTWRLGLSHGSEVFVGQSVPDILAAKLKGAGFQPTDDFELRLLAQYPKRELVMQHAETDLAFCSRLAEDVGIAFFFEHRNERDVIVFSDDNGSFGHAPGQERAPARLRGEGHGVYAVKTTTRVLPGQCVVRDYNHRTPSVSLTKSSPVTEGGAGTVYEYGGNVATPDEAERVALVRAQEIGVNRRIIHGECDLPRLAAGTRTVLEGHIRADGELLIVEAEHHAEQGALGHGRGDEQPYSLRFRAIPATTPFRPPRKTPKPRVLGAITGVVEATKPGGKYAELDEAGSYRVRFMFDRGDAPAGAASSLLRMAQPTAGAGAGFHFPLRDGTEVIITCIDGDPDRPVIAGAVPNARTPSPVTSKNAARNIIKTGGGSEINIDDTEGSSRVKITVPHGKTSLQLGAPNDPTAGFSVISENDAKVYGTNINLEGTNLIGLKAPDVVVEATTADVRVEASASVQAHAPVVSLDADGFARLMSGGLTLVGGPVALLIGQTTVVVNAHDTTVGGATVTVVGGTVNVEGTTVNIKGNASVNLNPE